MNNSSGIYKITNVINGKVYIGKSKNLSTRLMSHENKLKNGNHINKHLQEEYDLYGNENFKFEILTEISSEHISNIEAYFIEKYNSTNKYHGYNQISGKYEEIKQKHVDHNFEKFKQSKKLSCLSIELDKINIYDLMYDILNKHLSKQTLCN